MFTEGNREYSEEELLLGLNHKDKSLYNEYLKYLLKKYNDIKKLSKNKNSKIDKMIYLLNSKIVSN